MTDSKIVAWITEDDFDNLIDGCIVKISRQKTQRTTVALYVGPQRRNECLCARELTDAAHDVLAERERQVTKEGWTPGHDDLYADGDLAEAAAAYASEAARSWGGLPGGWPWDLKWWKPTTPRRNLVKAGALILAEIERLDRVRDKGEL